MAPPTKSRRAPAKKSASKKSAVRKSAPKSAANKTAAKKTAKKVAVAAKVTAPARRRRSLGRKTSRRVSTVAQRTPLRRSKKRSLLTVMTYLDNGLVFSYTVASAEKAREHAAAILSGGYNHVTKGSLEIYPPHRIVKLKVVGNVGALFPDRVTGV